MELIIIISLEITGIKLLPKIREFNNFFLELTAEKPDGDVLRTHIQCICEATLNLHALLSMLLACFIIKRHCTPCEFNFIYFIHILQCGY